MKQKDFIMNTAALVVADEVEINVKTTLELNGRYIIQTIIGFYIFSDKERILISNDKGKHLFLHTKIISIRKVNKK
jgi:hypothetical protein